MNILIATKPDDLHAILVKLVLEKKGVNCQLLFTADMPTRQKNTFALSIQSLSWTSQYQEEHRLHLSKIHFDSVWWRRARHPHIPHTVHSADQDFIKKENLSYHESIPYLINQNAWWVNPYESIKKSNSKIRQLILAKASGFLVPETLISNCPKTIKDFAKSNQHQELIYKPFTQEFWTEKDCLKIAYTNKVNLKDMTSDAMLQIVPGIYQQYIDKKYELRVTCFGTEISAVKLDSQNHPSGITDWRQIPMHELCIEEIELSEAVKHKIIQLMKAAGIVFACFDFIVTPDDELYFLEFNEQGQFLWVEEVNPDLKYLDRFVHFLMGKQFQYEWKQTKDTVSSSDFDAEAMSIAASNNLKHVDLNKITRTV